MSVPTKMSLLNSLSGFSRELSRSKMKYNRYLTICSLVSLISYVLNGRQNEQALKYFLNCWEKWGMEE